MDKTTILIAEDDRAIRKMLEIRLKREGFEVITVEDGKKAMEIIEQQLPELVVTDLMMPFRNGLEILEKIKSLNPDVPVIVLTSAGQENTVNDAFELGADDYIAKPFNPGELIHRIKRFFKK